MQTHKKACNYSSTALLFFVLIMLTGMVWGGDVSTLYLKNGSVLTGEVLRDGAGNYLYYSQYGELFVKADEVIYVLSGNDKTKNTIMETFLLDEGTSDVISILQRDIPTEKERGKDITLLMPGKVEAVYDESNNVIPFQIEDVGSFCKVTVNSGQIPPKGTKLFLTTIQKDFLVSSGAGSMKFQYNLTPDNESVLKFLVKYPKNWKVEQITPPPTRQYDGLLIWNMTLKRQHTFTPQVTFRQF